MKLFHLTLLALTVFSAISCKKQGCTDKLAINYSSKAKDNCCCEYEGQVVLWYPKSLSDSWVSQGITSVKFYLDGVLIHTKPATDYWTGPPTCGESATLTFTKKGDKNVFSGDIEAFDQNGTSIALKWCTFISGECERVEL
jgi:hypothetical protein